jgi:uncharacterized protein YkwD
MSTVPADRLGAVSATAADEDATCALHPEAVRAAALIRHHALQTRRVLRCSPQLAAIAADKAREMARRNQVTHAFGVTPPNRRLRLAGYPLDPHYPRGWDNQVEAVAGGFTTAEDAVEAWLASPGHRQHLLAEHPFYAEQDEIGVGYHYDRDSDHVGYWVVYIARAKPGGADRPTYAKRSDRPQVSGLLKSGPAD